MMQKRSMTCTYRLNEAPQATSGTVPIGQVDGVTSVISGGTILVPSGPSRGLWSVGAGAGAWTQVATGADAPLQVQVANGKMNGLWVLPDGHDDTSVYGSP